MLSRTADHVFWLGRYAERAENLARTLDVQYRLSLLPRKAASEGTGWDRTLSTLRLADEFAAHCGDDFEAHRVIDFLAFDRDTPSSILSCLRAARENARAVRGTGIGRWRKDHVGPFAAAVCRFSSVACMLGADNSTNGLCAILLRKV